MNTETLDRLEALLAKAADGEGLRKWFKSTLRNRAIDHVRKELKKMKGNYILDSR